MTCNPTSRDPGRQRTNISRFMRSIRVSARVRRTVRAAAGTIVGSAAGALLPFVIARLVNPTSRTDVLFLVSGVAQLAAYLLASVVEGAALPPAQRALEDDRQGLRAFSWRMLPNALALALPITLGVLIVGSLLLRLSDADTSALSEGYRMLVAILPLPLLASVSSVYGAAHYAQNHYAATTASQGLRAIGGMGGALLAADHGGLVAIAVGLCAGEAGRTLLLAAALPRSRPHVRVGDLPGRPHRVASRRDFLRSAGSLLTATVIVAVNPLVDKVVASWQGVGSVTLIELAEKLFYVPMVLLFSAVTIVSGVVWGRLRSDLDAISADFWRVQRLAAAVSTGIAVLAIAAALMLGERLQGFLGLDSRIPLDTVFALYVLGLPFGLAASLAGRLLVILGETSRLPALAIGLVVINVVADVVGAAVLGVHGIALSSTLVRVANAAAFLMLVRRVFASSASSR